MRVIIIVYNPEKENWPKDRNKETRNNKTIYWIKRKLTELPEQISRIFCEKGDTTTQFCILMHCPDETVAKMQNQFKNIPVCRYSTAIPYANMWNGFIRPLLEAVTIRQVWEQEFDKLWYFCENKDVSKEINEILHLFHPLDIDMQALKTTENAEAYLNDTYADLEELYNLDKYKERDKNDHYRQKLYDLRYLLDPIKEKEERASAEAKKLTPINNPSDDLRKLAGLENGNREVSPIYKFLESLDERKTEAINYFLAPFELSGLKGCDGKGINSFHDWYCALDSCLRGAGSEGK